MINKFQQGEAPQGGQNIEQQIMELVQAAMQGNQKAQQQIQQIMQAAEQGDPQAQQIAGMIQQVAQALQGQARSQQIGGKLAYIHKLRTGVNMDEEVVFERCGGRMTKKVKKKACGGIKLKAEDGGSAPASNKKAYFDSCGGTTKKTKTKKCYFGGSL